MEARQQNFVYDNRLTPMARLYLLEVYKYFGTPVDCEVDDKYFATLFKTNMRTVRNWRTELKNLGYIEEVTNQFGKKITQYTPNINNHFENGMEMRVVFKTKEGKVIENSIDAFTYFDEKISATRLNNKMASKVRLVCNVFANSIFQEQYYNLKMSCGIILNQEFFQFVIEHFTIDYIYTMAGRIMNNYAMINNLNLYILASIAQEYKGDYELFRQNPAYLQAREDYKKWCSKFYGLNKGEKES